SLVDSEKTRFDFAHDAPMTHEQIAAVERIVNDEILQNHATRAQLMAFDEAVQGGAMALFGEKYGDEVRVLDIGSSRELCGGTHVERTGDIGLFKIVSEGGVAAGVRRIEAITGANALAWVQETNDTLLRAAASVKAKPSDLIDRIGLLQNQVRTLERELDKLKSKQAASVGSNLADQAVVLAGDMKLLFATVSGAEPKALRGMVEDRKSVV